MTHTADRRPATTSAPGPSRRRLRPTTALAAIVLAVAIIGAVIVSSHGSGNGPVAAKVGPTVIAAATVDREVAAILAEPAYKAALAHASTVALAAPVDPKAVATARGDPDDLRVSLVPAGGASSTRGYTDADLRATVLTRLLYVSVLRQLLDARHLSPTPAELSDGRQQAQIESGVDASGASLFDRLPSWYQAQLAERGADVAVLERSLVGSGGISPDVVQAAYQQRQATDFTTVCLRTAVVPAADEGSGPSMLAPGGSGSRSAGCAPMAAWAPDVANDVRTVPVGSIAPALRRGPRLAFLLVTNRTQQPLSAVAGNVRAVLGARYTDIVNSVVEDQLALSTVTVAAHYGTYEDLGAVHGVLPPDALSPAAAQRAPAQPPATSGAQRLDPFD